MKQRMFNRGKGWYTTATNYQDENDKTYVNFKFAKGNEPQAVIGAQGYAVLDLDILEQKYICKEGKVGVFIFKYTVVEPNQKVTVQTTLSSDGRDVMGHIDTQAHKISEPDITIDDDELPFY